MREVIALSMPHAHHLRLRKNVCVIYLWTHEGSSGISSSLGMITSLTEPQREKNLDEVEQTKTEIGKRILAGLL